MHIDQNTVEKIAHLSRLELKNDELIKMQDSLSKILSWMEKLNELDTENISPITSMSNNQNIMRDDIVKDHISHYDALKNVPKKDTDYVRVPKVLD